MGSCTFISKLSILTVNFLFWILAGGLLFICSWVLTQYFSTDCHFAILCLLIPLAVIGGVGLLLFINSFIGCCGAVRESKFCLSVFFILTFTILCLEISAGVVAIAFQDKISHKVKSDWKNTLASYTPTSRCHSFLEFAQSNLTCCGCQDYRDWLDGTDWNEMYPQYLPGSCCDQSDRMPINENVTGCAIPTDAPDTNATQDISIYNKGCCHKLSEIADNNVLYFAIVGFSIAALQSLVLLISCSLMCRRKEQFYIHLDADLSQPSTPSASNF